MQLDKTRPSGAEEWSCPICGRRLLMRFQSQYQKLDLHVFETGDESVAHVGSKGGLLLNQIDAKTNAVDDDLSGPIA